MYVRYNYKKKFFIFEVINFANYFLTLTTKLYFKKSILGAVLLLIIVVQCISGIMLSFYYISEPMIVPFLKSEEDMMDLYNEDFLYIHERLVDYIFIFMYLHMYRKLSYNVYNKNQINSWVTGATLWLMIHFSIFFGLTLSCTHLSDVTLTIAANIMYTLTFKTGKVYWWIFTNKTLNSDTVIRVAYVHYVISLFILSTSMFHAVEMHYDWKNTILDDGSELSVFWLYYVCKDEISFVFMSLFCFYVGCRFLYAINEPLSYEIFMWGDVGLINDVRFLGVAPHWYFRAYMGWLIVCPHHYIGVLGLLFYIVTIYFQIYLKKLASYVLKSVNFFKSIENTASYMIIFTIFLMCVFYTSSILPFGKYFNRLEGNLILLLSYFIIIMFLTKTYIMIWAGIYWVVCGNLNTSNHFFVRRMYIFWYKVIRVYTQVKYNKKPYSIYYIYKKDKKLFNEFELTFPEQAYIYWRYIRKKFVLFF